MKKELLIESQTKLGIVIQILNEVRYELHMEHSDFAEFVLKASNNLVGLRLEVRKRANLPN